MFNISPNLNKHPHLCAPKLIPTNLFLQIESNLAFILEFFKLQFLAFLKEIKLNEKKLQSSTVQLVLITFNLGCIFF